MFVIISLHFMKVKKKRKKVTEGDCVQPLRLAFVMGPESAKTHSIPDTKLGHKTKHNFTKCSTNL